MNLPKKANPRKYTVTTKVTKQVYDTLREAAEMNDISLSKLAQRYLVLGYIHEAQMAIEEATERYKKAQAERKGNV